MGRWGVLLAILCLCACALAREPKSSPLPAPAGKPEELCPAHCLEPEEEEEEESDSNLYAYICIPLSFVLSLVGSVFPMITDRVLPSFKITEWTIFRFCAGTAGGIVIGVALVHSYPEGSEAIDGAVELGWLPEYAWGGFFGLLGLLATITIEIFVTVYLIVSKRLLRKLQDRKRTPKEEADPSTTENELKDAATDDLLKQESRRRSDIVLAYLSDAVVLLFGLSFHSFFVGINQGLNGGDLAYFLAVIAHQFFEGVALGVKNCLVRFRFSVPLMLFFDLIFAASTPVGIGIGLGIKAHVEDRATVELVSGISNSISAGILIWVGCIHLIKEELDRGDNSVRAQIAVYLGVLLGAAIMAVIGIWA